MVDVDKTISKYGYANIETIKEDWSVYSLEDETIVKIKVLPLKFLRQGNNYLMNSTVATTIFSPPELKGEPSRAAPSQEEVAKELLKVDMGFDIIKEPWNEYMLDDGIKWSVKTVVISVSKTKLYDPEGEPIYLVNNQVLTKRYPPM